MKQFIMTLTLALSALCVANAQSAEEWLAKLDSSLGERYAMHIAVTVAEEEPLNGFFMVEGDGYYINLDVMEVYSDGKLRYEVNNARMEVTEDRVNLKAVDLLTNPTRAFSFVDKEYSISLGESSASGAVLKLVPRGSSMGLTHITLVLGQGSGVVYPKKIEYSYDDESITISLSKRNKADSQLPRWDKERYKGYDIVSFL